MSIRHLHELLLWPQAKEILKPSGAGPRLLADLARRKIEKAISLKLGAAGVVQVGLLLKNPQANGTEAPIALVCQFERKVDEDVLALAHCLAWNFARSPLLVTIEPHQVRTWTCCEPPADQSALFGGPEIDAARLDLTASLSPSDRAAHALNWVRLVSGDFYQRFPDRFDRDGRADRVLLKELTTVRKSLKRHPRLEDDTIHDLLARTIFIQFLFDRKDANGHAALNASLLQNMRAEGHLKNNHDSFQSILADHDETYRFFRWLNGKFNGDLFPGKGATKADREAEWREEMTKVQPMHLQRLAEFVSGQAQGGQRLFWPEYAFDVIPLEFISSIYEEFVASTGAHYTPGYLVDFMLDEVLPWESKDWDLRILDPACGSGIFLVKAYQRLIQRWKNSHPNEKPDARILRRLLEKNLFGVDLDEHAVRVASFSLYLTMCDELDPKTYLRSTKFPRLRGKRLIHADFFREDLEGIRTEKNSKTFHRVIGNAPWGERTETELARQWAENPLRAWPIPNKGIGTLFLAKALSLTRPDGRVSMIQPASSLLFNRSGPANRFREKLFSTFKVDEVVNLSTLRFELFENATSPPCIVTLRPTEPDKDPILYISPKQAKPTGSGEVSEGKYAIIIEPHDISRISSEEAVSEPFVWTALAWGGRRDLALIRELLWRKSLSKLDKQGLLDRRKGIVRGDERRKEPKLFKRRILETPSFPPGTFLRLNALDLPVNENEGTDEDDSTTIAPFELPQLILKKAWQMGSGRLMAALVVSDPVTGGVVCTQSYVSVHTAVEKEEFLEAACLSFNSVLAVYFLLLTSGRLASYRPEVLVEEILAVPIPDPRQGLLRNIGNLEEVDRATRQSFEFKDAEWILVEDLFKYTMPDFQGDDSSPGRQPTLRQTSDPSGESVEPHLRDYCRYFIRVLKAGFGQDKGICATVYQDSSTAKLPVRMVAIHLDWDRREEIVVEAIDSNVLCDRLVELDNKLLQISGAENGGVFYQRVARVYDEIQHRGRSIPTIYIIKPDRIRYWLRSIALRDADEVAADIHLWQGNLPRKASAQPRAK